MFTPAQIDHYNREGYVVYPDFISGDGLASLKTEIDRISEGNTKENHDDERMEMEPGQDPDGTLVRRIYEPCTFYEPFRSFSESTALLDCVEQLFGPDLIFHYSKINMKPQNIGSIVEWHQDLSYYPLSNRDSVSILFYLDDTSEENGCLKVIPRCHNAPLMSHSTEGFFRGKVTEEVNDSEAVLLEGTGGSAIFMSSMTPHASAINSSDRPRKTLILSYRAADAFPIHCGAMSNKIEAHSRLVRGKRASQARFTMTDFPIPQYEDEVASLYDLQERSRKSA